MTTKAEMISWFRSRYETANEGTSYDSSEGGFQYAPGSGPIDVNPALQEQFPDADLDEVKETAQELEDEGPWVDMRTYDEQE